MAQKLIELRKLNWEDKHELGYDKSIREKDLRLLLIGLTTEQFEYINTNSSTLTHNDLKEYFKEDLIDYPDNLDIHALHELKALKRIYGTKYVKPIYTSTNQRWTRPTSFYREYSFTEERQRETMYLINQCPDAGMAWNSAVRTCGYEYGIIFSINTKLQT